MRAFQTRYFEVKGGWAKERRRCANILRFDHIEEFRLTLATLANGKFKKKSCLVISHEVSAGVPNASNAVEN
jgi:hypothetical protein